MHLKAFISRLNYTFNIFIYALLFFCFFHVRHLNAQPHFYQLTQDQGLSNANVNCILQDQYGFMWFGTNDGLNKFDGYGFTVYRNSPKDQHSISSNHITCMHEDESGLIWIGTKGGGLNAYDSKLDKFIGFQNSDNNEFSIRSNDILSIYDIKNGMLLIGTDGAGFYLFNTKDKKTKAFVSEPNNKQSLSCNEIIAIEGTNDGAFWLGTWSGGLNRFDISNNTFQTIEGSKEVQINRIWTILADTQFLWIGTFGNGLIQLNLKTLNSEKLHLQGTNQRVDNNVIWAICETSDGAKWIGTNNGLFKIENDRVVTAHYYHEDKNDGLISNKVLSIFQSDNGIIWIGTDKGICYLNPDPKKFHIDLGLDFLRNIDVQTLTYGLGHSVWIGTEKLGIIHLQTNSSKLLDFRVNVFPAMAQGSIINCLFEDSYQRLWVGTRYGIKIFSVNGKLVKELLFDTRDLQNSSNDVMSVCETDTIGVFWVGTDNGLFLVNSFDWEITKYTAPKSEGVGLYSNHILTVFKDRKKNIWVSTWNGLSKYNSRKMDFELCNDSNLANVYVNTMYDDALGNIWMGTRNGLYRYSIETAVVKVFREADGLCNNNVCNIIDDHAGNLWISTTNGLSRLNLNSLDIKNFDTNDGLINNNYNPNAGLLLYNQYVFLGGLSGLDVFNPDEIVIKTEEPRIVFNDFRIFNKPVEIGKKGSPLKQSITSTNSIVLTSKDAVFSIGFVALNYINTSKAKYLFKLDGLEKEWNEAGVERKVTYTNLSAGDYVFKVKATNEDGVWSTHEKILNIKVLPPWWKTRWFKIVIVLFIFGMLSLYVSYRNYVYNQRNIQLEKIIKERTSEILEQKERLAKQALKLTEKNLLLKEKGDEIQRQADEINRMNVLLKERNINLSENVEELSRARVMNESVSFEDFQAIYPDDESCRQLIFDLKQANGFSCVSCKSTSCFPIEANYSRRCKKCGYIESVTIGTIFSHLKFPIVKAFYILYLVSGGHKLTVDQLSELISLRRETCWSFKNKILEHMKQHKRFKNPQEGWKELILLPKKK
jgi:ligand-binding sensor domain-containing protein